MTAKFQVDVPAFHNLINARAIAFGESREDAFKTEARLLAKELMDRTPPFSGKAIVKMLGKQGKHLGFSNVEIESLGAKKVGERRVMKDIRRVIYGVRGAAWPEERPTVIASQTNPRYASHSNKLEFGILQKCQGKSAVRIYATKDGTVYGIDTEKFMPGATQDELRAHHQKARTKRGRVTTAASSDLVTGRWRWLNKIVTKKKSADQYVKSKLRNVGRAKGGWAAAFMRFGGKLGITGWIGRHARKTGRVRSNFTKDQIVIEMINRSEWASAGDMDGAIAKAMAGRMESIKSNIKRKMQRDWQEVHGK